MTRTRGRPRWLFPCACLAVAAILGSCGSDGGNEEPPDPVATVLVDPPTATLNVGDGLPFTAAALNAAGDTLEGRTIGWAVTGAAVSVDAMGLALAVSPGPATVTATSEGKVGSASVIVRPPPHNVDGTWYLIATTTDDALQTTCHDTATVTLAQTGPAFEGTSLRSGTCEAPGGPIDNSGELQVTDGALAGTEISFNESGDPPCVYLGALAGSPAAEASGTVTCQGGGFDFAGTWTLSRNPPPVSLRYPSPAARR